MDQVTFFFRCYGCSEYVFTNNYQCPDGHQICHLCFEAMSSCPQCHQSPLIRSNRTPNLLRHEEPIVDINNSFDTLLPSLMRLAPVLHPCTSEEMVFFDEEEEEEEEEDDIDEEFNDGANLNERRDLEHKFNDVVNSESDDCKIGPSSREESDLMVFLDAQSSPDESEHLAGKEPLLDDIKSTSVVKQQSHESDTKGNQVGHLSRTASSEMNDEKLNDKRAPSATEPSTPTKAISGVDTPSWAQNDGCDENLSQEVREAKLSMQKALTTSLSLSETPIIIEILREAKEHNAKKLTAHELGLTPTMLPALVENNPLVAIEALLSLMHTD